VAVGLPACGPTSAQRRPLRPVQSRGRQTVIDEQQKDLDPREGWRGVGEDHSTVGNEEYDWLLLLVSECTYIQFIYVTTSLVACWRFDDELLSLVMPHLTSYGVLIVKAQRGGGRREGHTTATGADAAVDVLLRANGNGR